MFKVMLTLLVLIVVVYGIWRALGAMWQGLHRIAGIETGTPRYALPMASARLGHEPSVAIPNSFRNDERFQLLPPTQSNSRRTKHSKTPPMPQLAGVTIECLNRMPTQAVVILDRINDKLTRYQAWRREAQTHTHTHTALSEKQFVIDRLIGQTLPEAVQQYDQLARFNPAHLQQPIHDTMTASDILIAVLQQVDAELDGLMAELNHVATNQLATTYRYIKARTQ